MKFWQRVIAGVLLVAVLGATTVAPAFERPTPVVAAPAEQAGIAAEIATVCIGSVAGVAACSAAAAAALVWYCSSSPASCTASNLILLVGGLVDWFNGGGTGPDQLAVQYAYHPAYFQLTPQMVVGWQQVLADWGQSDWTFVTVGGVDVLWTTVPNNELRASIVWPDLGGSNCTAILSMSARIAEYRPGGSRGYSRAGLVDHGLGYQYVTTGGTDEVPTISSYGHNELGQMDPPLTCADYGTNMTARYVAGVAFESGSTFKNGLAGWRIQVSTGSGTKTMEMSASLFTAAGVVVLDEANNEHIYLPLNVDALDGWDGTSSMPRADGTTGPLVVPAPASPPADEQAWWEGLFGGLGGLLQDIWNRLGDMSGTLSGIASNIAALPTTLTSVFDPAVAVEDTEGTYWPQLEAALAVAVPICLVDIGGLSEIMTGTGGPFVLDMPNPAGGTVHISQTIPTSVTQYTKLGSQVFAAVLVLMWSYGLFRRMFAGGGGIASE